MSLFVYVSTLSPAGFGDNIRDEPSHEETQKRFGGIETSFALKSSLRASNNGPTANQKRNPSIGTELLANQATREFCGEKGNKKDLAATGVSRQRTYATTKQPVNKGCILSGRS